MIAAKQYAKDVLSGKIVAGEFMKLACKRFQSDLKRKDIYFDEDEAVKITNFAERYCCLWEDKWRGQAVKVIPWMAFIWQQIYGWQMKGSGLRRIRKVYIQIAKKNAKTTIAGVTSSFHLFADDRVKTPKVFVGANNEDQAKICVNITGKIIEQSPALYSEVEDGTVSLFKYKENIVNIVHKERDGFIKALSKETDDKTSSAAGGKHGINPSLSVIDEYGMASNDGILETVESAQAAREEPLLFVITTAGFNKYGPCYTKLRATGIEVLRGTMEDDSYLVFIFEMDEDDKIDQVKNWIKSNPNLGVSVFPEFLKSRLKSAQNEGGSKETSVTTLNFNKWCDAPSVWIQQSEWDKNTHGLSTADMKGQACFGGLYTASNESVNCLVLYFPEFGPNKINAFMVFCWLAEKFVDKNQDGVDYKKWIDDDLITKTTGNAADHRKISSDIISIVRKYDIRAVGFDKTFGQYVVPDLENEGIPVMEIYQGHNNLAQQTQEFKKMADSGTIENFSNPVFAWHIGNTVIDRNNKGEEKPDKSASGSRIGIVNAALNAMCAKFNSEKEGVMNDFTFSSL